MDAYSRVFILVSSILASKGCTDELLVGTTKKNLAWIKKIFEIVALWIGIPITIAE